VKIIACCVLAASVSVCSCKRGADISADPAAVGQQVTLSGKVTEMLAPNVVELDSNRGDVIVVTPPSGPSIQPGDRVTVTGDVRQVTLAEFERAFADVDAPIEARIEVENIVAASQIQPG
jgi:hypothetical protein